MADRTETLLFLIDVKVNGARALAALDAELDTVMRDRTAERVTLARSAGVPESRLPAAARPGAVSGEGELWGVRGPIRPGSRQKPDYAGAGVPVRLRGSAGLRQRLGTRRGARPQRSRRLLRRQ